MHPIERPDGTYDAIIIGSGFAGTFFLSRFLAHASPTARILVIERGTFWSHDEKLRHRENSSLPQHTTWTARGNPGKDWNFTLGFGGSSNCWWGNTPRMIPNDFRIKSLYGVGRDWPLGYDDIASYYDEVEEIMEISGANANLPWPKSQPYPLPPHRVTASDNLLMKAYPGLHIPIPTARPSRPARTRPQCCNNGVCTLCPIDSKFTIINSFMTPYEDPRVSVLMDAEVLALETGPNTVRGVTYRRRGQSLRVSGDLVILAANAIINPAIMLRSGLSHPLLGRNLHEQLAIRGEVLLDGLDHFQGSTVVTGLNYVLYDGPFRKDRPSILIEIWNAGQLRREHGRWFQVVPFNVKIEDYLQPQNRVAIDPEAPDRPLVIFEDYSKETLGVIPHLRDLVAPVFSPLPVQDVRIIPEFSPTSSHIHGTTIMGNDPHESVVDGFQIHHGLRNLVVLGSGNFPSGSQTNPTLTLSALALRTADKLGKSA